MNSDDCCVLVVDDNVDAAETLAVLLEMDGYIVRRAHSGQQALALLEDFTPVCVLLDIHMPGLNGHELSVRLRERYGDAVVLIAVTGWGEPEERLTEAFALFDHYFTKPIDPAQLQRVLPAIG